MNDTNASFQADEPFFSALLTPHRSLGKTGFAVLMGALLFGWLVTGAFSCRAAPGRFSASSVWTLSPSTLPSA